MKKSFLPFFLGIIILLTSSLCETANGQNNSTQPEDLKKDIPQEISHKKLKVGVGVNNFQELVTESDIFVDKSLFIKEIVESGEKVTLVTRPRRWGKSLSLSMLKYFFNIEVDEHGKPLNPQPHRILFEGGEIDLRGGKGIKKLSPLKIAQDPEWQNRYSKFQGQYPVIFLSLKDIKKDTYKEMKESIEAEIVKLFSQHDYLPDLKILWAEAGGSSVSFRKKISKFIINSPIMGGLEGALKTLSEWLNKYHKEKVYILIDEYDTPLNHAYSTEDKEYYNQAVGLIRNIFSAALKENDSLEKGMLTGILRIAKADLFSGLNNLGEHTLLSTRYAQYFGFTEIEVEQLLLGVSSEDKQRVKRMYNGYTVGGHTLYNPWSLGNYLENQELKPYWVDSGGDMLLKAFLIKNDNIEIQAKLNELKQDFDPQTNELRQASGPRKTIELSIKEKLSMDDIYNPESLWSLLLFTGYLNPESHTLESGIYKCNVRIPNKEVFDLYEGFSLEKIERFKKRWGLSDNEYDTLIKSLVNGRIEEFEKRLRSHLKNAVSFHTLRTTEKQDPGFQERDYHLLLSGLLEGVRQTHYLWSETESGSGRSDIMIIPRDSSNSLGVIIELKVSEKKEHLKADSVGGIKQINDKDYIAKLKDFRGVKEVLIVSVAFHKKELAIASEKTAINPTKDSKAPNQSSPRKSFSSLQQSDKSALSLGSLALLPTELSFRTGSLNGREVSFAEHEVAADGDCGFHGLGVSRDQALQQLLETQDPEIRAMVADDMFELLISNTYPQALMTEELISAREAYWASPTEENRQKLRSFLGQKNTYQAFVRQYLNHGGWLSYVRGGQGLLNAVARLNNLNVYVWSAGQDDTLGVIHTALQEAPVNTVHLFHTQGLTHFNLLEEVERTAPSFFSEAGQRFAREVRVDYGILLNEKLLNQRAYAQQAQSSAEQFSVWPLSAVWPSLLMTNAVLYVVKKIGKK